MTMAVWTAAVLRRRLRQGGGRGADQRKKPERGEGWPT